MSLVNTSESPLYIPCPPSFFSFFPSCCLSSAGLAFLHSVHVPTEEYALTLDDDKIGESDDDKIGESVDDGAPPISQ